MQENKIKKGENSMLSKTFYIDVKDPPPSYTFKHIYTQLWFIFILKAENEEEADQWIAVIEEIKSRARDDLSDVSF